MIVLPGSKKNTICTQSTKDINNCSVLQVQGHNYKENVGATVWMVEKILDWSSILPLDHLGIDN